MPANAGLHLPGHADGQHSGPQRRTACGHNARCNLRKAYLLANQQHRFDDTRRGQYGSQCRRAARGPIVGGTDHAVQQVPQHHAQCQGKAPGRQHSRAFAAADKNTDGKRQCRRKAEHCRARPVQVCHAAHPVAEGIAVIPSLVSAGSAGLAQPGQRVPPADEQHRNAKPHHTGNDVAQCLHHNFTDGTAIQPDEIQPIPQRNGNIGSAAHIIAPRHKKACGKGHQHRRGQQPPACILLPEMQSQQDDQYRQC